MRTFALLLCLLLLGANSRAARYYVDASAPGVQSGASWADAFHNLQVALTISVAGDTVWVAAGTYLPTASGLRSISFVLNESVSVFGGFAGTESSVFERNIPANPTILTGAIGAPDTTDNTFHVVRCSTGSLLDGFTVLRGNANGDAIDGPSGGGAFVLGNASIRNCAFNRNAAGVAANGNGGAIYTAAGVDTVLITGCTFTSNTASGGNGNGGAIYFESSVATQVSSCNFTDNYAGGNGGAIAGGTAIFGSTLSSNRSGGDGAGAFNVGSVTLSSFINNNASGDGGGVHGTSEVRSCQLIGNVSAGSGGAGCGVGVTDNCFLYNNTAENGGGLYAIDPVIERSVFVFNAATNNGGAIWASGASSLVDSCLIDENSAGASGGGAYTGGGTLTVQRSIFTDNLCGLSGGALTGPANVSTCVLAGNRAANGGAINGGVNNVDHCTIINNFAGLFGGGLGLGSYTITSSIIWDNSGVFDPNYTTLGPGSAVSYSIVQGSGGSGGSWDSDLGTDGGNNLDVSPVLVDPFANDGRIGPTSPALNGAAPLPAAVPTDVIGSPRVIGGVSDIGAYEYQCSGLSTVFVDASATGSDNGFDWSNAFSSLRAALVLACTTATELWVAQGTYHPSTHPTVSFPLRDGMSVLGGFAGTESFNSERDLSNKPILSGEIGNTNITSDNTHHVVDGSSTDSTAVLDGFVIERGYATDAFPNDRGAGLWMQNSNATVLNVTLRENTATFGAALAMNNASPKLANLLAFNNTASTSGSFIHAVDAAPTVVNATIAGNSVSDGVLSFSGSSSPALINTVVWGNGTVFENTGINAVTSFSLLEGSGGSSSWDPAYGVDGGNNIDSDPLFVNAPSNDFRLKGNSPAIDNGNDAANPHGKDIAGNPRVIDTIDMGAFESVVPLAVDTPGARNEMVAYPNPFNPSVTVAFSVARQTQASLAVYDVSGTKVRTLFSGKATGRVEVVWDGTNEQGLRVASGVYFARLHAGSTTQTLKLVVVK